MASLLVDAKQTAGPTRTRGGQHLPVEVRRLLVVVQLALQEEGFGFVNDEFEAVVEQRGFSQRRRLEALRALIWSLGLASHILANSTGALLDALEGAIEDALARTFDS